ncbi:MAG: rod shape-determining protein RodA, partial [Proteobacteria bacterium]
VGSLIFMHVVVNIGMVIGLLPVVGLPLPLFSYGGSSVLSVMFSLGLVIGVEMRRLLFVGRS